jgi:predicted Zn-ribbon and HTH transcriptional regulator
VARILVEGQISLKEALLQSGADIQEMIDRGDHFRAKDDPLTLPKLLEEILFELSVRVHSCRTCGDFFAGKDLDHGQCPKCREA